MRYLRMAISSIFVHIGGVRRIQLYPIWDRIDRMITRERQFGCLRRGFRPMRYVVCFATCLLLADPSTADQIDVRAANVEIALDAIGSGQGDAHKALLELQESLGNDTSETNEEAGDETFEVVVENPESDSSNTPHTASETGQEPRTTKSNSVPPRSEAVKEARWQYRVVDHHMKQARQALRKAREAGDPAMRHHFLRQAEENKSWAEGAVRKLNRTLNVETKVPAPPTKLINTGVNFRKKRAWEQLLEISGGGPDDVKQLGLFDDPDAPLPKPPVADGVKPKVQDLLRSSGSKLQPEIIEFKHGQQIDIAPIRQAIAKVNRDDASSDLFVKCGDGMCPSRTLLRYFSTQDLREQLQKVGGVALNVTIDMLGSAGVPDFRAGPEIKLVDSPVLISLKRLALAASAFAADAAWPSLPERLRYPGNAERMLGFVLDPVTEDIYLVAARAAAPHRRVDIDSLILAVRQTWRDGKEMAVSLDPDPGYMTGPATPRFENVPGDSVTAKIMIEADQVMKQMVSAWGPYADQRYMPLTEIESRFPKEGGSTGRFWLNPMRLGRDASYVSVTGRTMLFETRVQALTEKAFLTNGRWQYQGTTGGTAQAEAQAFTERYDQYEDADDIEPVGIFKRLHGIVDLVTLAKLWRVNAVDYPVLRQIADLPYRRLTGDEAIPKKYPELYSWYPTSDGGSQTVFGGAVLDIGLSAASLHEQEDPRIAELEQIVDHLRTNPEPVEFPDFESALRQKIDAVSTALGRELTRKEAEALGVITSLRDEYSSIANIVVETPLLLGLPRQSTRGGHPIKLLLLSGRRAYHSGGFKGRQKALEIFMEATRRDPTNPEAWAWRARSYPDSELDAAIASIREAIRFAPWNTVYKGLALDMLWRKNPDTLNTALAQPSDAGDRRLFVEKSLELAKHAFRNGNWSEGLGWCTRAIRLDPEDHRGYFERGLAFSGPSKDLDHVIALRPDLPEAYLQRGRRNQNTRNFDTAVEDYSKVIALRPDHSKAYLLRAHARIGLTSWGGLPKDLSANVPRYKQTLDEQTYGAALADYGKALQLALTRAPTLRGIGLLQKARGRYRSALAAFNMAIIFNPTHAEMIAERGKVHLLLAQYGLARADFEKSARLDHRLAKPILGRGMVLLALGDSSEAKRQFSAYVAKLGDRPDRRLAHDVAILIGETFDQLDNPEKAYEAYSDAIKWLRKSREARTGRARAALAMGWYKPALRDLKSVIKEHGADSETLTARGSIYLKQKKFGQALRDADDALALQPDESGALEIRAEALEHLGRTDEAVAAYQKILRMDPGSGSARSGLDRLGSAP